MELKWGTGPSLRPCAAPLQQQAAYGAALKRLGGKVSNVKTVTFIENGAVLGTAQVLLRQPIFFGGIAMLPRGPIWQTSLSTAKKQSALALLAQEIPLRGFRTLVVNSENPNDAAALKNHGYIQIITPQHIAEIDLSLPEEIRLGSQSVKWRNRLRAAQKSRLEIDNSSFPDDPSHYLLKSEARQRKTKGYRALPAAFTIAYRRSNPKNTRLFTARLDGETIAAMLFLLHGESASYHIGWTNEVGRHSNAHNLLIWSACNWAANQGFRQLDLGTVDTESAPGLARFKIGTGACVRSLGGTWIHTPLTAAVTRLMGRIPPRRHHYHKSV